MISAIPTYGREIQYNFIFTYDSFLNPLNNIWKDVKEKK